ncbi:MAG: type II secretion system GspH family protein [Hydrogenothermaceae bacterium]|nr:type II secretion system GspH family protein [Hydrogenothermaceae bacterium]
MDRKVKAYTIFEILVALIIIGILMAVVIRPILIFVAKQRLNQATNIVVATLNETKAYSIMKDNLMGIQADQNTGIIHQFIDKNNNCQYDSGENYRDINLPTNIIFINDIFFLFDRRGYPVNASCGLGPGPVVLKNNYDMYKTICVDRYGRIRVLEGNVSCN